MCFSSDICVSGAFSSDFSVVADASQVDWKMQACVYIEESTHGSDVPEASPVGHLIRVCPARHPDQERIGEHIARIRPHGQP